MIPSLPYVKQKFAYYNALIFQNKLPDIPIRIGTAKSALGGVRFRKRLKADGTYEFADFKLTISARYDMPQEEVDDTIIHEMIHLYILSNQLRDTSAHGKIFIKLMNQINQTFGRHVSVSYRGNNRNEQSYAAKRSVYVLCLTIFPDGQMGIAKVAKTRVAEMWDLFPKCFSPLKFTWYISDNPFFDRLPKSVNPKIYKVERTAVLQHLAGAKRLERVGRTIRVVE